MQLLFDCFLFVIIIELADILAVVIGDSSVQSD